MRKTLIGKRVTISKDINKLKYGRHIQRELEETDGHTFEVREVHEPKEGAIAFLSSVEEPVYFFPIDVKDIVLKEATQ